MAFRILVIDDEPQVRDLLRRRMEMCGHDVVEAMDGEDAIEALENEKIDVVIADILMPKKDGLEVIMYVRKEMPHVPTIAISASQRSTALLMTSTKSSPRSILSTSMNTLSTPNSPVSAS